MKRIAIVAALLLAAALAACSAPAQPGASASSDSGSGFQLADYIKADAENGTLNYTVIGNDLSVPYDQTLKVGGEAAADATGATVDFTGPATGKAEDQVALMQTLITQAKTDGIVVAATNVNSLKPVMDAAYDAGIPVISIFTDQPNSKQLAFVGQDNEATGRLLGEQLLTFLDGKQGDVVVVSVDTAAGWSTAHEKGFREALSGATGLTIIGPVNTTAEGAQMQSAVDNALRSAPNAVAIASLDCCSVTAAAKWKVDNGADGVIVAGFDAMQTTLDSIESGDIAFSISQNPVELTKTAVMMLDDLVRKGTAPKNVVLDPLVVTLENAATVTPEG
ncbi:MAG: sugar ABC transporter substrate-binding protein [Protaetiibacter sp.]